MSDFDSNVFINCPFDDQYAPLLQAITFAVLALGFVPRSALETKDSGEVRLQKILKIIDECRLSVHDISRVEPIGAGTTPVLPRFNMPFECGLFFGATNFGSKKHRVKKALILDSEPYRYQKTMSDINGNDIECHNNDSNDAISNIRQFLNSHRGPGISPLPGEAHIVNLYSQFHADLPKILEDLKLTHSEIAELGKWKDFSTVANTWLNTRVA